MLTRNLTCSLLLFSVATLSFNAFFTTTVQADVLVVDRLSNAVYAYSDTGAYLNTVVSDSTNLNAPDGLVVSPDLNHLYVASSQNNEVVEYDYNYHTETATNPQVIATAANGLAMPNSMVFSPDGSKLFVANLNGTGISQLNPDGSNAGPQLAGGTSFGFSGLAFHGSTLLAGGFDGGGGFAGGTVAQSDAGFTSMSDLVPLNATIPGAAGVFVNGNDLYVTGLFGQSLEKFNATTGVQDATFNVSGLAFPQGIMAAPDGQGMLVGILGFAAGTGNISEYSYSGQLLGVFASAGATPGFTEATAFTHVPEPTSLALAGCGAALLALIARRRAKR
ncbi:MAG TPA: SMP-30/gluconolactonase/LRE family protein [Pirellulales bacterium]|jgi:DNA-binding beta-propeller fold protein YncE